MPKLSFSSRLLHTFLLAIAAIALSACDHKELTEKPWPAEGDPVSIQYTWAPTEPFRPEGMANIFYPSEKLRSGYWRYDCTPSGGTTLLPSDSYHTVAFNNDTESVIFSGIGSFETLTFSTAKENTGDIPADQLPSPPQLLYRQPNRMWVATLTSLPLSSGAIIDFEPRRITSDYHLKVIEIENLPSALRYYAAISGLSGQFKPSVMSSTADAVTMGGMMTPWESSTIETTVTSFGMHPEAEKIEISLYFWLADGRRQIYHYDVTDQVVTAPDPLEVMIVVKGPALPEITPGDNPGGSGGGMQVGVDDWEIIDIEL